MDLYSAAAASHVQLLVNGFHFFPAKVNLLIGERLEDVLKKVHFAVKRLHLQVTQDAAREILAGLVRVQMCQLSPAFESASISFLGLMLVFL